MNSRIHWMYQTLANVMIERQERLHDWKQQIKDYRKEQA